MSFLAAVKAMQIVVRMCWPRMGQQCYQDEVVKMLILSWINLLDDTQLDSDQPDIVAKIKLEIRNLAKMLDVSMKAMGGESLQEKVKVLVHQEPLLAKLFAGIDQTVGGKEDPSPVSG